MLSSVIIFILILFYNSEAGTHSKHVIVNGSLEKVQLTNESVKEEETKRVVNSPPIVEVIHGKVNSVIHEIRGSIEDIPPLLNDEKQKENVLSPTHLKHNTVSYELTESENGGASSVETVLDEVLLTRAASDLLENSTSSILIGRNNAASPIGNSGVIPELPSLSSPAPPAAATVEETQLVPPVPSVNGTTDDQPHDDIPSFSEWTKKQMAEAEKNKGENLTVGTVKVRLKNYASPDCGAKVVASNPEALSPGAILSPSRDDYMLNACTVKIWFVVELCEAIQPQRIEIGNFELYSSSPRELSIWVSDRFPTREWSQVSQITAKDERTVQSFPLPSLSHFAKYVKVELHSHYGSEHYCPISLFKAFGTSELEVLDNVDNEVDDTEEENESINEPYDEDEDPIGGNVDHLTSVMTSTTTTTANNNNNDGNVINDTGSSGEPNNLLHTAKAAVMSVVKKAVQVLAVTGDENNGTCDGDNKTDGTILKELKYCLTPAYLIVCTNCTDEFYNRVYEYLSCNGRDLETILTNGFIRRILLNTRLCSAIGLDWGLSIPTAPVINRGSKAASFKDPFSLILSYIRAFLNPETVAALCNYLAITEHKVLLNTSQSIQYITESSSSTPQLIVQPVSDQQENIQSSGTEIPEDKNESEQQQTTVPDPEKTIAGSISPTRTLPSIKEDKSRIETMNNTEKKDDTPNKQQQDEEPQQFQQQQQQQQQQEQQKDSDQQQKRQEQEAENSTNVVAEKAMEEAAGIKSTPSPDLASSLTVTESTLHSQSSSIPSISEVENNNIVINETENLETQIPLSPSSTAVPVSIQDEVVDPLTLASLFPELDDEGATEPATAKTSQTPTAQKESVFVRLANRIKTLEVNMSLSGQYLEELSRRYKKQVEELQRTLSNMIEERRLATERENLQSAQISSLTVKVDALTLALSELISEREKASMIGQHGVIIVVEVVVFLIVLAVCRWLGAAKSAASLNSSDTRASAAQSQQLRRHSMDNFDGPSAPKIRRPSEEACLPAGTTHKELLVDGVKRKTSKEGARRRKRRRKEKWEDEGIVVVGADGEETVQHLTMIPQTTIKTITQQQQQQYQQQDYTVRTALWSRAKRTSQQHTQTSSSQETICSLITQNNNTTSSTNTTSSSSTTTATTTAAGGTVKHPKKSSGGAIKKIVKKFF